MSGLRVSSRRLARVRGSSGPALRFAAAVAGCLVIGGLGLAVPSAVAAPTSMVDLGRASSYAVLSGASVGNTVSAPGAPHTTLRGDLGVKANTQPTGFPPGVVTGTSRIGTAAAADAHADLVAAYAEVAGRTGGAPLAGALGGTTVSPGLHTIAGAVSNTTTVTLDGGDDPNAVFVFQIDGAMAFAAGSRVVLTNGARASRVFWQVNGAGAVGANADFAGTLMAMDAVSDATWNVTPAALTDGTRTVSAAVTDPAGNEGTDSQQLTVDTAAPAVTIAGGANALTNDPTPEISGMADVAPGVTVTVDLADETLTGPVQPGGAWSVTAADLSDGPHRVVMAVSDAAGNTARLTQTLTVDTVSPLVAITGASAATTTDFTPTITGTSDAVVGTIVAVSIGGQTRTALVQADGTWNATPNELAAGTWVVVASAPDLAHNEGSATQMLTIATAGVTPAVGGPAPVLTPVPAGPPAQTVTPVPASPTPDRGASIGAVAATTVAPDASQKVTGPLLSIGTKVRAPAKASIVVTATGSVKIKGVKKTIKLTSTTVKVAAGQSLTLKLKPKGSRKAVAAAVKRIRTAVRSGKKVTATITLKIVDAAGRKRTVRRIVRLTT